LRTGSIVRIYISGKFYFFLNTFPAVIVSRKEEMVERIMDKKIQMENKRIVRPNEIKTERKQKRI
jgi:hypothetical protein